MIIPTFDFHRKVFFENGIAISIQGKYPFEYVFKFSYISWPIIVFKQFHYGWLNLFGFRVKFFFILLKIMLYEERNIFSPVS